MTTLNYVLDAESEPCSDIWTSIWTDKLYAAGGLDGKLRIYDPSASKEAPAQVVSSVPKPLGILSVDAHKAKEYLLTSSLDSRLSRLSMNGEKEASASFPGAWQVSLHPTEDIVATSGPKATLSLIKTSIEDFGQSLASFQGRGQHAQTTLFSPDGRIVAVASNTGEICLYDVESHELLHAVQAHSKCIRALCFSQVADLLFAGSIDTLITVWDLSSLSSRRSISLVTTLEGHTGWVTSLAVRSDDKLLVSTSTDGTARIWDLARLTTPLAIIKENNEIWTAAWRPQPIASSQRFEGAGGTILSGGSLALGGKDTIRFYRSAGA